MFVKSKIKRDDQSRMKLYKPGRVLKVLSSQDLLAGRQYQALLQQVNDMSQLSADEFALLYEPIISSFTEFVQLLPTSIDSFLSGLLNESLARATIAMRTYTVEYGDQLDPLMNYAVFTATLLREVSKVITLYRVVICEKDGTYLEDWYAFNGALTDAADFYKIYPLAPLYQRLDASIIPILARQLMPKQGFDWLTADMLVFADWLDALRGDSAFGGIVCHVLDLIRLDDLQALLDTLVIDNIDLLWTEKNAYGEAFYEWLRNAIASGEIDVNSLESGVHVVDEGVFLDTTKLIEKFILSQGIPASNADVYVQFLVATGLIANYMTGYNAQYLYKAPLQSSKNAGFSGAMGQQRQSMLKGLLIRDKACIFTGDNMPDISNSLHSTQSVAAIRQVPSAAQQASHINNAGRKK